MKRHPPDPIDQHVGARLRLRRSEIGMSQMKLGERVGVTFQQVQKYEKGTNRISASRLYELARVLHVPVSYFFDEMAGPQKAASAAGPPDPLVAFILSPEGRALNSAFHRIKDAGLRRQVVALVRLIGKQ